MSTAPTSATMQKLASLVTEALQLADALRLDHVGIRLEEVRQMLDRSEDDAADGPSLR